MLSNGRAIVDEWTRSGKFLRKLRNLTVTTPATAPLIVQPVVPPPIVQPAVPPPVHIAQPPILPVVNSPPRSPLAELSPRFANNFEEDRMLSPTHGQVRFVQEHLQGPWRFATVASQKGGGATAEIVNKSIYKFVRPNAENTIEDVSCSRVRMMYPLIRVEASRGQMFRGLESRPRASATRDPGKWPRCCHPMQPLVTMQGK